MNKEIITLLCIASMPLFFSACEKCLDCRQSKFTSPERAIVYAGRDHIEYSNGLDTVTVTIELNLSEPADEECGSYPLKPSCTSLGFATLSGGFTANNPLHQIHSISATKHDNAWECTNFEIGNTFFLDFDEDYKLTPRNHNSHQVTVLNNYMFNQVNYGDVQEIVQGQPLGNVYELTRALYHPELGIIELTYSNPSETWRQLP